MSRNTKWDTVEQMHVRNIDVDNRAIYLFSDIDSDSAAVIIKNIHFLNKTDGDITLYINSVGGDWASGMAIYSVIKKSKNNVNGYVLGEASSMGSVILQACHTRIMSIGSYMLVHPGGSQFDGTAIDLIERSKFEDKVLNQMYSIYYERMFKTLNGEIKFSFKKFKDYVNRDRYLYPDDAKAFGLIDSIDGEDSV